MDDRTCFRRHNQKSFWNRKGNNFARSLLTDPATVPDQILSALVIIFSFIQFILGIWQFILLYKGLKVAVAQELNRTKNILN